MKVLNLLNIRIDGGTQARNKLNQDVVKEYAEHMREGDLFPPLIVYHDGSEYWLVDGFHRLFGYRANGVTSAECDVRTGTLREAILFSKGANGGNKRGLPASPEDNRTSIIWMLNDDEYQKWPNTAIAKHIGVSSMTVGRIKSSIETKSDAQPIKTVIDKNGKENKVDTTKLTGRPKTTKPDVSTEDPTAELKQQNVELIQVVNSLSDENTVLRDKIAIGQWDASDIEKIDAEETMADLRERIRILEQDNKTVRHDRDMYQNRCAEYAKTIKSLQTKLKKLEKE
jgi:hypothetical protein